MKQLLWILILISGINHAQDIASSIAEGNIAAVKELIKQGADINAPLESNGQEVTPLRLAVRADNLEIVKILIEAGADPNANQESLPLHVAAFKGNFDIVHYLLGRGASLVDPVTGWTALHSASSGGHLEIADYLIVQGADVNAKDEDGETPLMYAAEYPIPLAKLLIGKGAELNSVDSSGYTALDWANKSGRLTAKYLRILGAMQGDAIRSQLFSAVLSDDTQAVAALAAKGISMNILQEGDSPLTIAAIETQSPDMMKLLYQLGADPSLDDTLFQAAYRGLGKSLRLLTDMGAPLSNPETGWTALHSAASGGHLDLAEWLIVDKGSDVNAQDVDGETPLMYAAKHEDVQLIELLLAKGADINLRDNDGQTAYDWAVERDNTEVAEYLKKLMGGMEEPADLSEDEMASAIWEGNTKKIRDLVKKGFDLNAESLYGAYSLLEFAAYNGTLEIIKTLVNLGADPKMGEPLIIAAHRGDRGICEYLVSRGAVLARPGGWTALHAAAAGGHLEIVEYFLKIGQSPNARDQNQETPLMYASGKSLDVVKALISAGAVPYLQDDKERTALKWAMEDNKQDVILYFNAEYPDLRPQGLLSIIRDGNARDLYEATISPEDFNKTYHYHDGQGDCLGDLTLLQIAGHEGNLEMVKALTALGADVSAVNALGDTASSLAGQAGHTEVVDFFRTNYPDMYSRWDIFQIIRSRDPQILKEAKLPVSILNAKYHYHNENNECFGELSLLEIAIAGGDLAMTEALAILGADISANYPIMIAAYMGYTNITSYLISQGSPMFIPEAGWTALHSAAIGGHAPMIEYLIVKNQDVNAVDMDGKTPLMLASRTNLEAVQALIKARADVKPQDTAGRSALDYAMESKKYDIVDYYRAEYPHIKPRITPLAD